jgi:hypothetical protein
MNPTRPIFSASLLIASLTMALGSSAQDPAAPRTPATQSHPRKGNAQPAAEEPPTETEQPASSEAPTSEPTSEPSAEPQPQPSAEPRPSEPQPSAEPQPSEPEPAPANPPKEAAAAPSAEPRPSQCAPGDVAAAMDGASGAVARVEAPGATGLGFVAYSRDHVVTALSVVDRGRGIRVLFGEERRDARVVAVDRAYGLAVLELDSPAPTAPLAVVSSNGALGDPVLVIGLSHERRDRKHRPGRHRGWRQSRGAGTKVIHPGVITSARGESLRSDALESRTTTWGAALLDCRGRVVGVGTSPYGDEAAGAGRLRLLEERIGDDEVYAGDWSFFHPSVGVVGQLDHGNDPELDARDRWLGFSVGTALIGEDRFYFPLRFTATWLLGPDQAEPFEDRRGHRLAGQLGAGYRIMLSGGRIPIYLVPQIGFAVQYQKLTTSSTRFESDGRCDEPSCPVTASVIEQQERRVRAMPTAGLGLQLSFGEMGYQILFDPRAPEQSVHQLTIGAQW